ncbi:hypothetical protein J2T09_000506 [Neorhizobium huautlense]|uniref:Uncharacterized protein n=1 Tax=Neorhizobium huautlense TaxID=67774 RepID=A0ABT9PMU5_9HYPH|nr:hypothetical protein [Neorhizobium huautlense]MDP9835765.1 hypothetical protein [Neorhizobium huautlense]
MQIGKGIDLSLFVANGFSSQKLMHPFMPKLDCCTCRHNSPLFGNARLFSAKISLT